MDNKEKKTNEGTPQNTDKTRQNGANAGSGGSHYTPMTDKQIKRVRMIVGIVLTVAAIIIVRFTGK